MATKKKAETSGATGRIARVNGPVVDIEFPHDAIPGIYNALTTEVAFGDQKYTLTLEVAQHLGDDLVRAIALKPTDGLVRGGSVSDTGVSGSLDAGRVSFIAPIAFPSTVGTVAAGVSKGHAAA